MRYLSFDIECCDGRSICEFGYVITDESFNIIEKDCFTVNPVLPFSLLRRPNQDDMKLYFSEEEYYASPEFPDFYDRIRSLLTAPDQTVIGYSTGCDAGFLRDACLRYGLPSLDFGFVDIQTIYGKYSGEKMQVSLGNAGAALGIDGDVILHKSDEDAYLTLKLTEELCRRLDKPLDSLVRLYPDSCGTSRNYTVRCEKNSIPSMMNCLSEGEDALSHAKKEQCIREFSRRVRPHCKTLPGVLNGKKLCFSAEFEQSRSKDTLVLIQALANCGCTYSTRVFENDYYVATDEELNAPPKRGKSRYAAAMRAYHGSRKRILSLDRLLQLVGLTGESLSAAPIPTVPEQSEPENRGYTADCPPSTIGDLLRAQGMDLWSEIR